MITVKDLKEKLKELNDEDEVMVLDTEYGDSQIEKLTIFENYARQNKQVLLIEPKETYD